MIFLLLCFAGCLDKSDYQEQLPEIVFICDEDYSQIRSEGETQYITTFFDKNGNQYITSDSAVCTLGFKELIEKYSQGDLDEKIELRTSCNSSLIEDNYRKDMKTYTGQEIELLKYNDNVSIVIEDIQFLGDCYNIYITCKGYSDYSFGQIFYLENQLDIEIETSEGTFIMGARGLDTIGDERRYTYYLYPKKNTDMKTISNIEMNLVIDDVVLVNYNRK